MEEVSIPLFNGVYKNIDETVSTDQSFKLIDGYLDEAASIGSRPGLLSRISTAENAPIDGVYFWDANRAIIAVCNGKVYYSTDFVNASTVAGDTLAFGVRPTFAGDTTSLYIANGGRIVRIVGLGAAPTYLSDADAPTAVTHITLLDTYLIANEVGSETWYFSEVADPTSWSALDFATAGSEPDLVNAIHKFRGELYLFGRETVEIWEDDGQTPFARVNGGSFDTGCIAPYSVINLENEIIWLNNKRRFVSFKGSGIEILSTQYDKEISEFNVVSDCTADRYDILGKTFIVFQFPGENRTIVYNKTNDNWTEWGYWNAGSGSHEAFLGSCHVQIPDSGRHFIGTRKATGKIYEMSPEYFTDDGTEIRLLTQSGHINYGTNNIKINNFLTFRVKRGYITDASEPVGRLRFRDNNREWGGEIPFSLGKTGEYFNVVKKFRLGQYRSRQYEFSASDAVGFLLSEAKEEIEVTSR